MQAPRRTVAAILLATAVLLPAVAEAGSRAQLNVSARVLTFFRVSHQSHPPVVQVEDRHVRQGYVDLESASTVSVESNTSSPIAVRVGYDESLVDRVAIRMDGAEITASHPGESGLVPNPVRGKRNVSVHYRLYLRPGVVPGQKAWPVALAFTPTL